METISGRKAKGEAEEVLEDQSSEKEDRIKRKEQEELMMKKEIVKERSSNECVIEKRMCEIIRGRKDMQ